MNILCNIYCHVIIGSGHCTVDKVVRLDAAVPCTVCTICVLLNML